MQSPTLHQASEKMAVNSVEVTFSGNLGELLKPVILQTCKADPGTVEAPTLRHANENVAENSVQVTFSDNIEQKCYPINNTGWSSYSLPS